MYNTQDKARKVYDQLRAVRHSIFDVQFLYSEELDPYNVEDRYTRDRWAMAAKYVNDALDELDTLFYPVIAEGELKLNSSGKFSFAEREYVEGVPIEYRAEDAEGDMTWFRGTVALQDGQYVIADDPEIALTGLYVRIR